jgi:glycosyltransferase involved in cell wall biosynthesis
VGCALQTWPKRPCAAQRGRSDHLLRPNQVSSPIEDNPGVLPPVSVIITTKDRSELLGRQLAAVRAQDYAGELQIVVSDDGSVDDTPGVLAVLGGLDKRLLVVRSEVSHGSSSARNAAARVASGELLAFCDDDDVVPPDWLRRLVEVAHHADLVGGVNRRCLDDASGQPVPLPIDNAAPGPGAVVAHLGFLPSLQGGNMAYWRRVTERVGGWDESLRFASDAELAWRAQLGGFTYALAERAVVDWVQRALLRQVWRQRFNWGIEDALLVSRYRTRGCPQPGWAEVLIRTIGLPARSYRLLGNAHRRRCYVEWSAQRCGRLVGALRYRVRCV